LIRWKKMLRDSSALWESGVGFQYARFETDTNGQIRVTFTVEPEMQRYFKTTRASLKINGDKRRIPIDPPRQNSHQRAAGNPREHDEFHAGRQKKTKASTLRLNFTKRRSSSPPRRAG